MGEASSATPRGLLLRILSRGGGPLCYQREALYLVGNPEVLSAPEFVLDHPAQFSQIPTFVKFTCSGIRSEDRPTESLLLGPAELSGHLVEWVRSPTPTNSLDFTFFCE